MKKIYLLLCILTSSLAYSQSTCWQLGTGVDGIYHATANTSLASGTYNFSSFKIDAGVVVTVTGTAPLVIYCTDTATVDGTLTVSGANGTDGVTFASAGIGALGVAGGGNGGDGTYSTSVGGMQAMDGTNTGFGTGGLNWTGGGGAGYATVGGSTGGAAGIGGIVYGTSDLAVLTAGSGGGGGSGGFSCGSGGGGAGGGIVVLNAMVVEIGAAGVIESNGGNGGSDGTGNCGGGGAGSGGSIFIGAMEINNAGFILAEGGAGGASAIPGSPYFGVGGNGSDGRIRTDYVTLNNTGLINPLPYAQTILNSSLSATICDGDSYVLGSNTYTTAGVYTGVTSAVNGCDSLVALTLNVMPASTSSQSLTICEGDNVVVGTNTYTTTGIYTDLLSSVNGCDSTVTTDLTVISVDASVSLAGTTITATQAGATYQWVDCDNGNAPIAGATNQSYTAVVTGNYAVEVTYAGCTNTSSCSLVDFTGLDELLIGDKTLVKIIDFMGRETEYRPNTPLIYVYSDGTRVRTFNMD